MQNQMMSEIQKCCKNSEISNNFRKIHKPEQEEQKQQNTEQRDGWNMRMQNTMN